MRRVNEAIKEIIGTAITSDLKDPRIGFVTLTGVDTAPDLSHAKVFVSVYGKQAEKDATLEGLRHARPYLQRLIADELNIRRTPMLEFVYDESVDQGMRIQAILKSSGAAELAADGQEVEPGEAEADRSVPTAVEEGHASAAGEDYPGKTGADDASAGKDE
jgi:ribosome-binding factor A